jgi:hypothetical protein
VEVRWKLEDAIFKMQIKIPVGSNANVKIPKGAYNCKVNGKSFGSEDSFICVGSGVYEFICNMNL